MDRFVERDIGFFIEQMLGCSGLYLYPDPHKHGLLAMNEGGELIEVIYDTRSRLNGYYTFISGDSLFDGSLYTCFHGHKALRAGLAGTQQTQTHHHVIGHIDYLDIATIVLQVGAHRIQRSLNARSSSVLVIFTGCKFRAISRKGQNEYKK
jgi:hypothetical protein